MIKKIKYKIACLCGYGDDGHNWYMHSCKLQHSLYDLIEAMHEHTVEQQKDCLNILRDHINENHIKAFEAENDKDNFERVM